MTTERERHRCYGCKAIIATKRRGVVKVVAPAVAVSSSATAVIVRCKCGKVRPVRT